MTIDDLLDLATTLGIDVQHHHHGPKGWYCHASRTISLHATLRSANLRCTLAHELAHAIHGDELTGIGHLDTAMERRADATAANWLISSQEYKLAESLYNGHRGAIARELGVTIHLLTVWQDIYERLNSDKYVQPL